MNNLLISAGEHSVEVKTFREDSTAANTNGVMDALEFLEDQGALSTDELFDAHKVILRIIKSEDEISPNLLVSVLEDAVPALSLERRE